MNTFVIILEESSKFVNGDIILDKFRTIHIFLVFYSIIEQLGGKQLVMQLLAHEDPNVRYEALLAVQKLMVHNWEYLGRQLEKEQTGENKTGTSPITGKV